MDTNTLDKSILDKMAKNLNKEAHPKQLTRQQRRIKERIEFDAHNTLTQMAEKFLSFFTMHDNPEGEEVQEKIKQMNAQWKNYCHNRNLLPTAYDALNKYMNGVLNQYQKAKV